MKSCTRFGQYNNAMDAFVNAYTDVAKVLTFN